MTVREAVRVLLRHDGTGNYRDSELYDEAIRVVLRALSLPTRLEIGAAPLLDFLADYNGWVPVEKRRACEKWLSTYKRKAHR